jgi:hypothetical protein
MSEPTAEDDRLESVAETIKEGHQSADQLADENVIDPDAVTTTEGDGADVQPDDPA